MGIIRPATPGFIVTLVATALLAVVSFCVPYFKSVYFLKATINVGGTNTSITFGTLGYCSESGSASNCSRPTVGYELDINDLVGNNLPIEIPTVVVKWLTYALVLHIVALGLSAGSAVFGLLAHVREVSMTCCSTCVSGFAAAVALLAFIFDLALFFIAKGRINKVDGASAEIGNALWLTLAAWVLLFFSGCFYTLGRCCVSSRSSRDKNKKHDREAQPEQPKYGGPVNTYPPPPDQNQLAAVKAEADRKARQKEVGLPAFQENHRYNETQPLTAVVDGDDVYMDDHRANNYHDLHNMANQPGAGGYAPQPTHSGYVQAPAGTRAVDEYYNPAQNAYPPQPHRQASGHSMGASAYAPSNYPHTTSPPPMPPTQYLTTTPQSQYVDRQPSSGGEYGHQHGGTTYHSAYEQQYDHNRGYSYDQQQPDPTANTNTGYYTAQTSFSPPQRENGYGQNSFPPLNEPARDTSYFPYPGTVNTSVPAAPAQTSPVRGPRAQNSLPSTTTAYDAPPMYDDGMGNIPNNVPGGAWASKQ